MADRVAAPAVRSRGLAKWMRFTAVAATVAAALVVAMIVAINRKDSENPGPDGTEVVVQQETPLPDDSVVANTGKRPIPPLILVYDLAITKTGQRENVFTQLLAQASSVASADVAADVAADSTDRKLEPRYEPREPQPKSWYNSGYVFGMTRGVADSAIHPAGKAPLFVLTLPLDLALLPFTLIGGLFG